MNPEQRREMIVRAAVPLVAEYGAAVTTLQVARAAGIGEATIFRAFTDKSSLLDAVLVEVLRPDHVLREIASISLDQPLADRLIEAADAVRAHLGRMGTVLGALHASGERPRRWPDGSEEPASPGRTRAGRREDAFAGTRDALAELFEPERDTLRLPAGRLADLFVGLLLTQGRMLGREGAEVSTGELVDLFLHGALAGGGRP
jgi:AcrR family transcriptional regulator